MVKENTVDQLRMLNELFAHTGASVSDRAEHIRQVLNFLGNRHDEETTNLSFVECADRLARLHFSSEGEQSLFFAHWDVPKDEEFSPLWIRQALIAQMKQLAGYRAAFLLITGLREAVCPKGTYWTKKRQEYYDRVCEYINELVCLWSAPNSQLQLALF